MTTILALDPGNEKTGWVIYGGGRVLSCDVSNNRRLLESWVFSRLHAPDTLAIEMVASYGMPVGKEIFDTCVWIGRFIQAWREPEAVRLIYRKEVCLELCGSPRAKDANIRQALLDLLGPKGTKRAPGPTYGVSGDMWAALAVAVIAEKRLSQRARAAA